MALIASGVALAVVAPQAAAPATVAEADIDVMLKSLGWTVETDKDSEDMQSWNVMRGDEILFSIYQYRQGSDKTKISSLGYVSVWDLESGMPLEPANAWNSENRFSKVFLDEDKDPFLVDDLRTTGLPPAQVEQSLKEFKASLELFEKEVLGGSQVPRKSMSLK